MLISFSHHCIYSSLILYPKWTNYSFLKISRGVKSETLSINFLYFVTLKFVWSILLFELIFFFT